MRQCRSCVVHEVNPIIWRELQRTHSLSFCVLQVPEEFNGFCYVYEGSGKIGGTKASEQQALVMGKGAHSAIAAIVSTARSCSESAACCVRD